MTSHIQTASLLAAIALIGRLTTAHAQPRPCRGPGGRADDATYQRVFDVKSVQAVDGTIAAVEQIATRGMFPGIHLRLKTSTETIDVHLGPAWFIDSRDISLAVGDKVQIRASRVKYQGKPVLIAMTLTKGDMTLRLRDADGFPYWAGWRRRFEAPRGATGGRGQPR